MKEIYYTAYFVDEPKKLTDIFIPKHNNVYAHHSTNVYKPDSLKDVEVGKKTKLKILGRAFDDKGDTLIVENPKSKNKYPHITISCIDGISPQYSNELLGKDKTENNLELFDNPFFVAIITEGYVIKEEKVFLS